MHIPVNRVFNNVARNLGLQDWTDNVDSWAEWAFEAEQYIGSNQTFLEKEITYSSTTAAATATITWNANPSHNSWISINGTKIFFRDSGKIIGDVSDTEQPIKTATKFTILNLLDKINESKFDNTISNITATSDYATTGSADDAILTLTYNIHGDVGNSVKLESSGEGKLSSHNLTGGKELYHTSQLRLPDNMVKMLSVRVGDSIVTPTSSKYKSKVSNILDRYYVNGNRLNFSSTTYTDDIVVTYLAVPMSPEGWPMVKQGHEEAVATYIMWKYKLIDYYAAKVPQYIVKDLEKRWYWLCGQTRGNDNMPNSSELLKIGKLWNSKIPITSHNAPFYDGLNSY
jgi:hypothetical protein